MEHDLANVWGPTSRRDEKRRPWESSPNGHKLILRKPQRWKRKRPERLCQGAQKRVKKRGSIAWVYCCALDLSEQVDLEDLDDTVREEYKPIVHLILQKH
jgi:hypothetical protein